MRRSLVLGLIVCLLGQASWNLRADPQNALLAQDAAATEAKKAEEKAADDKKDDSKKDEAKSEAAKAEDKKKNIHSLALFTLDEDLPEGAGIETLFGDTSSTLSSTIEHIDAAVADKKIAGIVLSIKSPGLGRGKVEELRAAVARARKAGKKVYALADELSNGDFLLASACDEVILPPSGTVTASGVRAEVTFYKDLFDKLGVKADMLQVGDFKGAAEPFVRSEMSAEFRAQFEALIDDFYNQMIDTIAGDRKLDRGRVKDLLDEGLYTAAEAKECGLIDRVAYEDEFRAQLKEQTKADEVKLVEDYGDDTSETELSGISGMMKLMQAISGGGESAKKAAGRGKKIAVVYATGVIVSGEGGTSLFESVLGGDTIVKAIREAEADDKVVAIVLRVDSPGGSALASDLIWREIVRAKKPVVASMGDMAASGGYYISMGADKILAEAGTLTGSIGVVGGKVALRGLFDKVGIKTEVISRGRNSGWESMDQPFSDSERQAWLKIMRDIYKQFTTKAAEGRKLDLEKLEHLAQGKVYTGRQALSHKLVDQIGTLDDAVAEAKKLAGLEADAEIERLILPEPKSFIEELFGGAALETHARREVKLVAPLVNDVIGDAAMLSRLFAEPAVTVMPFRVRIK